MLNFEKSFLRNLFDRFSSKENKHHVSKSSKAVKGLKARNLSMEPLEERQLLSVTTQELSTIANTYTDFDMTSVTNVIEITSANLSAQSLANAINTAQSTSGGDLIVVRTIDQAFTIDLAEAAQYIEATPATGSITIVGFGETALTLTSNKATTLSITSGVVNLGNIKVVGTEAVDENQQPLTTESPILYIGQSAKVVQTNVTTAKEQIYTTSVTDNAGTENELKREAIISYRTDIGIWSVDFELAFSGVGGSFRGYVTGLKSQAEALEVAQNFSEYKEGSYLENSDLVHSVTNPRDAEINGNTDSTTGDSYLSWAATTANMLYYTGWGNKTGLSEDDIYDYILKNFSNGKYTIEGGVEWYMNGETHDYAPSWQILDKDGKVVSSSSDATKWAKTVSDGGNVFGSQYSYDNYAGRFATYNSATQMTGMSYVKELLESGYAVAANMQTTTTYTSTPYTGVSDVLYDLENAVKTAGTPTYTYDYETGQKVVYDKSGNATIQDTGSYSIWGYVYNTMMPQNSTNYYVGLFVTNPLDSANSPASEQPNKLVLKTMNWVGSEYVTIRDANDNTLSVTKQDGNTWQTGTTTYIDKEKEIAPTWNTTPNTTTGQYSFSGYTVVSVTNEYRINSFVFLSAANGRAPVTSDPYEPNNNALTVDGQTVGEEYSSNLGVIEGYREIKGLNLIDYTIDPEDWFKFKTEYTSSSGDYMGVQYSTSLFSGDIEIYLYNRVDGSINLLSDYKAVKTTISEVDIYGNGTNTYELKINLSGLEAGDYYVQVVRANKTVDCKDYTLMLKAASDDEYEINNTLEDITKKDAKANLGALSENVLLSDLVMKQVSTASVEGSEVDGFRFEMTGVGGPNSYIEIQFTDVTHNVNDSRLELRVFKEDTEAYYTTNPNSWGSSCIEGEVISAEGAATTIVRASLDGCESGVYFIKITGFINAQNLLNYKLNIHLSEEGDPAGIGTTSKPDFVVTNPEDQEWEKPIVIAKEQYENHDTEGSGYVYSNDSYFYSKDTMYMNLSYKVAEDSSEKTSYNISVSLVVNGKEIKYEDFFTTLKGEYATNAELRNAIFAKLTNELELTVVNGEAIDNSTSEVWDWAKELKDGMVISVVDNLENVVSGYVYQNGNFIAISSGTTLASGDQITLADGKKMTYKAVNLSIDGKAVTAVYISNDVFYPADFERNTDSANLIAMKIYTTSGTSDVFYNIAKKGFYTSSGQVVSVSPGTLVSYTNSTTSETTFYTYMKEGTVVYFLKTLTDLSDYKTVIESATSETIGNNTALKLEDGTIVYYNAGKFYTSSIIASGTMLQINGTSDKYCFSGFASTDIESGLWMGTKQFEGKFLKQAAYTQALYCQDSSYSNTTPLYYNANTGYFYRESTFVTKISIANGTLFAKSTSPSSAEDYFVYKTNGTSSAVPYGSLWTKAVITTGTDFVKADASSADIYHYQFTANEFGAFRVDYTGTVSEGAKVVMNSGAVNQKTLVYHIAAGTQTKAGFYQITEYDPIFEYTARQTLADGTEDIHQAAVAITANGLRQVYNAEHFFADGTKLLFYRDALEGGIAASYLKITPSNTDLTLLDLYKNDIQFIIYSSDGLSEYNVNNNSASTSFNVFRTQDDFFIPNATVTEMINSKNPETYDPNKEYSSTDMVNPNLGPISGELVVDNLVMLTGNDWFSFELQGKADETNSVKIDFLHKLGDLDLYVYAKDSTYPNGYRLVGRSCTLNDTETVNLNGAEPGTYYVRVVGFSEGTNPNYKLTINGSEPISLEGVALDLNDAKVVNSAALITWDKAGAAEDYVYGDKEEYFISTDVQWISKEDFEIAKAQLTAPTDADVWKKAEELGLVNSDLAVRYKTEFTINTYNGEELEPETTYFYRVRGNNNNSKVGHTEWTAHKEFTTDDYFNDTKYYAIVIGSSEYSAGTNYSYMYDDAYSVYNNLLANAPQYTANQICYLNGKVTLQQINQAFAKIGSTAGANDVVFVYYAGLGTTATVGPETASYLNTWNSTISVSGFYDLFNKYLNVGEVQIVLNPYYFDSAVANYSPYSYTGFGNALISGYDTIPGINAKVTMITNANDGENVQLNKVGGTIYGYWLNEAMTLKDDNGNFVADTNKDGRLSMEEVQNYVKPRVITESGNLMTPQYLTSDAGWESILIKGDWTETTEYLAEVGDWFDNGSIVVTTGNDVVDKTDGLTSLREAIDQYLGVTVYGDDAILYDKTVINHDGVEEEFKYGTTDIEVGDTFKIGDTDYRYSVGLVANVGNTGLKKDDKILTDGSKFTIGEETYTYTLDDNGNIVIKDSEGNEKNENDVPYVDVLFKTPTSKIIDVVLEDGTVVSLKQSGIMEETKVLNKITFADNIDLYNLEKPIEIDNDALKNVAEGTAVFIDGSSHNGDLVINGNGDTRLFTITYDADITDPAINTGISINFSALNLIGGVADNESEFGSKGGAIYNDGENVYLVNTVIRDNGLRSGEFLYNKTEDTHLNFENDFIEKDTISFNGEVYTAVKNSSGRIVFTNKDGKALVLAEGDVVTYTKVGETQGVTYTYTASMRTENGGAIFNAANGKLTIVNSTISGNTSDNAAIYNEDGTLSIYNSIVAFNDAYGTGTVYDDLYSNVPIGSSDSSSNDPPKSLLSYSFIGEHNGNVILNGTNISAETYTADKVFKDFAKRDFNIVDMAPVINTAEISLAKYSDGTNVEKDIAGYSRSLYGKVDMGAYEWKSYDLTMDTVVTTLGESDDISDGKTSLREAISYAGQNYPLFNALSKYEGQTMTVNGTEVVVTNGQFRKGSNIFTDYSNGDVVVLEDGTQAKISKDAEKTYIETTMTADVSIVFDLDGVIANDYNKNEQAFLDAMTASGGVLTIGLTEGVIGIYDTVVIDGENLQSKNALITNAVTDLLITNGTGKTNSIFTVDAGAEKTVSLENLTLSNGNGTLKNNDGGSAVVQKKGNLTVDSVVFENNYADNGAAINSASGTITVTDSIFRNNGVSQKGGAIYAANTTLTVTGSTFVNNTASMTNGQGGALYLATGTIATLTNTELTNNATSVNGPENKGGTIYVETGAELGMTGGSITGSASHEGGAIYNAGSIALQKVSVLNNTAAQNGGAIYNTGNFYAEYSTITGNKVTAESGLGGGIYNAGEGRVLLLADQISGNTGGGIYDVSTYAATATGNAALNYTVAVADSIISGNTVNGGIDSTGTLYVISSTIVGNINNNHNNLGHGIYYSKLLYLYNTVVSYNGGTTSPGDMVNVDCKNGAPSEITGSLIGGAPVFATASGNFVSPAGWASWDLTSSDTVNICEKGNAANVYLTYYDFKGNAQTLRYDYTGRNLRTTVATAGTVIDRGAYQTAAENRNAYIVNTLDEYENGVIIYDDEYVTLLEAISNVSSGEADSENIYFADYAVLAEHQEIRGQASHSGDLTTLTYGAVKNLFLDGPDAFYNIDGAITNTATGITKNVTIDASVNTNADKTPFIVNEAGTYVTIKNMSVTGGYASTAASAIPSGDAGYGGAFYIRNGYLNLESVTIFNNAAALEGGAIYVNGGKLRLTNSLIYNNEAEGFNVGSGEYGGGGIFAENHSAITIVNSTISKNTAQNFSGIYMISSSIAMYNSSVLGNQGKIDEGLDFYSKDVNYSLIHNNIIGIMSETQNLNGRNGNYAGTSTSPISVDKVFSDYNNNDFTINNLKDNKTSLAVNTGSNFYARDIDGHLLLTDILGSDRFIEVVDEKGNVTYLGIVDIGAYENTNVKDELSTVVTTLDDITDNTDGLISLREAIENAKDLGTAVTFDTEACKNNTENFDGQYIIHLNDTARNTITIGSETDKDYTITIDASNIAGGVIIDGAGIIENIFSVVDDTLELKAVTLTGAKAFSGSAINISGTGNVSITNGLIYGNTATSYGSAINLAGFGSLTLLNTTIAKNIGPYSAVYVASGNTKLKIMNSIIAENTAENGVADLDIVSKGDRTISTSLIGQGGGQISYANLVNTSFVGTFDKPVDPGFLDSASNDFTLSSISIALNAGANASVGRPGYLSTLPKDLQSALGNLTVKYDLAGNDRIYNGTVDMGAYEFSKPFEDPSTVVTTLTDVIDPVDGKISLREAINYAGTVFYNSETGVTYTLGKTITFDMAAITVNDAGLNLPARTITLDPAKGAIVVDKDVTIDASSVDGGIIIDAKSSYNTEDKDYRRVFEFSNANGTTAQIVALTLTGGDAGDENGGAIYQSSGNLYVINSVIYKNNAYRGGAIYSSGLSTYLNVVNTTITKNNATKAYGGIFSSNSNVTVANTLVAWSMNLTQEAFYEKDYTFKALLNDQYGKFTVDNYIANGTYYSSFFTIADTGCSINDINASKSGVIGSPLNPWFTDWDNDDFTLSKTDTGSNSLAINGGTNDLAVYADGTSLTRDITGGPRFIGKIEIGAFETGLSTGEIPSIIVTTTADIVDEYDGLISLREAVTYAGHYGLGTRITFAENLVDEQGHAYVGANAYELSHTVVLDHTLTISKDLKIDSSSGLGKNITITMADGVDQRLIYVDSGDVEMIGLTLTQRYTKRTPNGEKFTVAQGGAIYLRTGTLTVRNTLIYDNCADAGAAIYVAAGEKVALILRNVTVTDNYGKTGAVFSDGNGFISIYNTIVARNNMTDANYNDVVVKYSDLARQNDRLDLVGNFFQREEAGTGLNQLGAYNQTNGNLIGYYSTNLGKYLLDTEAKDYLFKDWENDDFTLKDNSLAVNGGINDEVVDLSELDCSGGRRLYGKKVDMGAFENLVTLDSPYNADGSEILVTTDIDIVTTADGLTSLREAIDLAERLYDIDVRDKTITFSQLYLGNNPVMQLADKTFSINRPISIDASAVGSFMIDCDYKDCAFVIDTNITDEKVKLQNIAIKDGRNYNGGGIFLRTGSLELLNVLVCASQARIEGSGTTYGGGIYAETGTELTLVNCTVASNEATYGGGLYAAANTKVTILNSIIALNTAFGTDGEKEGDLVISGAVSESTSAQNRIAYTLIGNSKKMYDILGNAGTNVIGYGPDLKVDPCFTNASNYQYTLNPMYNRVSGGYDNPAKGRASNDIATEYGITVDLTKARYNTPADMGAYQIARETASTIVTTTEDIVDSTDNLISLREAVLYYCTDNIFSNYSTDAEHTGTIGFSDYYSHGYRLPDLCPITFSEKLFEGTTGGITIKLDSSLNLDWSNYSNIGGASPIPIQDVLIDASSVDALGGVTIDGQGKCENIFALTGFCRDKTLVGKYSVQLELIGLTLTGANSFAVDVDPYCMLEMHDCVVYGNGGGVCVWDENNASYMNVVDGDNKARDKWYGIANICNSTIVDNEQGIYNNGETKVYNSIVVLNSSYNFSQKTTKSDGTVPPPAYRYTYINNSIYSSPIYGTNVRHVTNNSMAINVDSARKFLFVDVASHDYRLAEGSIAINMGNNLYTYINKISHADPEVDRNGANRIIGGTVDIGAYEYLDANFKDVRKFANKAVVVDTTEDVIDYSDGKTSLREAVAYASQFSDVCEFYDYDESDYNGATVRYTTGFVTEYSICYGKVTFSSDLDGQTIELDPTLGAISITTDLWITASNLANGVTIDGNNGTNAFYINVPNGIASKLDVILEGMNYTNGYAQKGGAIYIVNGNVLVKNSKFYKNEASKYGGAIFAEDGELTIYGSQIGGNKAAYYGGVVNVLGTLLIVKSQIAENYGTVGATDAYSVSAANKDIYYYTAINQRGTRGNQEENNIFGKMAITNIDGRNTDGRFNYIAEMDGKNINTDIGLYVDKIFAGNWVNGVWTYGEADGVGGLDVIWKVPTPAASEAVDNASYAAALAAVALEDDEFNWLFDEE